MRLLLVTGAGASRNLAYEGGHMPLMQDWSDRLCDALDQREAGLASACGLARGAAGPEFEENLGLLLRWHRVRPLQERFLGLGGPQPGSHNQYMEEALRMANARLDLVMETMNATLYEQFGQERVDDRRAEEAFGALLNLLGNPELVVATTNYDRSAEAGLRRLGFRVETGFLADAERTPTLHPADMVNRMTRRTEDVPVLHLHGAVGWYETGGHVEDHFADKSFNPSLGTPVLLYPDPDKEPTSDAVVSELWTEFRVALAWSDHVLVVGHSLHDPALLRELQHAATRTKIAVSYIDKPGQQAVKSQLGTVASMYLEVSEDLEIHHDGLELRPWLGLDSSVR